ncbi:MAG: MlaD family protein [Melioribacteraceae bacterium]|nr:MlaD family protein [Melioribacteraceae bacterium]
MKDQRKTEFKVGLTIFISLIALFLILAWAKNVSFTSDREEMKVRFDSVSGLEVGDPVTINGVRKGYVSDIKLNQTDVLAILTIESEIELKEDSKFNVVMLDLMGGKKVEITPGISSNEIDFSKVQVGSFAGDISSMIAGISSIQNDLISVVKEIKFSLNAVNALIGDSVFTNDLKATLANTNLMVLNLTKVLNDNKSKISLLLDKSNNAIDNLNGFYSENKDSLKNVITELNSTLTASKKMVINLDQFLGEIKEGKNNIGKLMNDPKIYEDLQTSLANLKKLTKLLTEQLEGEGVNVDAKISIF